MSDAGKSRLEEELLEARPRLEKDNLKSYKSEIYNIEDLKVIEYEEDGTTAAYLESEVLEGLIGYTEAEVLSEIDMFYNSRFTSIEFDGFTYGNGWALISREE